MLKWISERLRKRAAGRKEDAYLQRHGVNLRCPHCETWGSDAIRPPTIKSFGHPIAVQSNCGQCEKSSYWVCEAGFWFTADQFGIEINDTQQRSN